MTLDDASIFPLINIIWELLLNDEGKEVYLWNQRISGRRQLGLPVPRLGPEQSRNTVFLSRLDKDESPSRLQFHETRKSHHQGSAVLGDGTGAGGWVFPRGFPAWDASECTLNRRGDISAMSLPVGVQPTPYAGQILRVDFSLPTSCFQNGSLHHQCLLPSCFSSQCLPPATPLPPMPFWHPTPPPHLTTRCWVLTIQLLQFSSVTSSRRPSLTLPSQSWVRVLLQAVRKTVLGLSPNFCWLSGNLRCPLAVEASPRSLPLPSHGLLPVCLCVSHVLLFTSHTGIGLTLKTLKTSF